MAIQKSVNAYSFMCDAFADLPAAPPPGQLAYVIATGKTYYSQNGTWVQFGVGSGTALPSFDNPPASPSAYDDEFDTGSLDAKWTVGSTGTTNPVVAGTVNPLSSLTTPVYDIASMASWLLVQSDNSTTALVHFTENITLDTDATIFAKMGVGNRIISSINEGNVSIRLYNAADTNESVYLDFPQQGGGAGFANQITVENNGAFGAVIGPVITEKGPLAPIYAVLWKDDNVYHAAYSYGTTPFSYLGSVTKTGVTTLDRLSIVIRTANETPSNISGVDFVRYYSGIVYGLAN